MTSTKTIISVNEETYLSVVEACDKDRFILYLNDPDIYRNTLNIPNPYKERDALFFIESTKEKEKLSGKPLNWAIRNQAGELIGGIGHFLNAGATGARDEIGYWLGRPFWNKGVMTEVVKKFAEYLFAEYPFERLEAHVFAFNPASARVLEKAGFTREGFFEKHYLKNNEYIDGILYVKEKSA